MPRRTGKGLALVGLAVVAIPGNRVRADHHVVVLVVVDVAGRAGRQAKAGAGLVAFRRPVGIGRGAARAQATCPAVPGMRFSLWGLSIIDDMAGLDRACRTHTGVSRQECDHEREGLPVRKHGRQHYGSPAVTKNSVDPSLLRYR
jgi:hypothetical protein